MFYCFLSRVYKTRPCFKRGFALFNVQTLTKADDDARCKNLDAVLGKLPPCATPDGRKLDLDAVMAKLAAGPTPEEKAIDAARSKNLDAVLAKLDADAGATI